MTKEIIIKKHFVIFYSPGTFVPETSIKEIDSWDINQAIEMSKNIKERYNAIPYGFRFITKGRTNEELDSKKIDSSPFYFINCKILTLADIKAENNPKNKILISNMECNNIKKVARTIKGWLWTTPIGESDIILKL